MFYGEDCFSERVSQAVLSVRSPLEHAAVPYTVDEEGSAPVASIEGSRILSKKSFTTNGGNWRKELYNYRVLDTLPEYQHRDLIIRLRYPA